MTIQFDYNKYTFDVINKMLSDNYLVKKVQIEPYNDFIETLESFKTSKKFASFV